VKEDEQSRPSAPKIWGKEWKEVLILPFDSRMSQESDEGWLQWGPEECQVIPKWMFCVLGLIWPVLWLVYRRSLQGQSTDW